MKMNLIIANDVRMFKMGNLFINAKNATASHVYVVIQTMRSVEIANPESIRKPDTLAIPVINLF
jgi:hypothetical protein